MMSLSGSSLEPSILSHLLTAARELAHRAGAEILKIEQSGDFDPKAKGDGSPLTRADQASHEVLSSGLASLTPQFPILSEESADIASYETRRHWPTFWLLDPLDGTKEFLKRNGEYTVNIALIHKGTPILGVVLQPATSTEWHAAQGLGAWKVSKGENTLQSLPCAQAKPSDGTSPVRVVASRSHLSEETSTYIAQIESLGRPVTFLSCGSSLKLCLVAEGSAEVYPRLAPTMEWDTAAAHAVALEAGSQVLDWEQRVPLTYNKPSLLNPWFLVLSPDFQTP